MDKRRREEIIREMDVEILGVILAAAGVNNQVIGDSSIHLESCEVENNTVVTVGRDMTLDRWQQDAIDLNAQGWTASTG